MAWDSNLADNFARRSAIQSDVAPRSINRRVLRSDDTLFQYDDNTITPVADRKLAADTVFQKKLIDNSDSPYTIDYATDKVAVYRVDPSDGATTINLEDPATFPQDMRLRIENRHYGHGLIDRGDCESATPPTWSGETSAAAPFNLTWERSTTRVHTGTYSYKMIKGAAATEGFAPLQDVEGILDMHGLVAGATYTVTGWVYIDTMAAGEAGLRLLYYDSGVWHDNFFYAQVVGEWTRVSGTVTIPSTATGIILRAQAHINTSNGEIAYFDEISVYRHYDVTVSGPIEDRTSLTLSSEGDYAVLTSDGDKYVIEEWYSHGQNTNGSWKISNGLQVCWLYETVTNQAINNAYGSLYQGTRSVTFPRAFSSTPAITCSLGKWGTSASWGGLSGSTSTGATLRFWDILSRSTGTTFKYSYIAIGRAS